MANDQSDVKPSGNPTEAEPRTGPQRNEQPRPLIRVKETRRLQKSKSTFFTMAVDNRRANIELPVPTMNQPAETREPAAPPADLESADAALAIAPTVATPVGLEKMDSLTMKTVEEKRGMVAELTARLIPITIKLTETLKKFDELHAEATTIRKLIDEVRAELLIARKEFKRNETRKLAADMDSSAGN